MSVFDIKTSDTGRGTTYYATTSRGNLADLENMAREVAAAAECLVSETDFRPAGRGHLIMAEHTVYNSQKGQRGNHAIQENS